MHTHACTCTYTQTLASLALGLVEWWNGGMGEFGELPNVPDLTVDEAQKKQEEA